MVIDLNLYELSDESYSLFSNDMQNTQNRYKFHDIQLELGT